MRTAKYPPRGIFPVWVYEHNLRLYDIREEIDKRYKPLYSKFIDTSSSMGRFCEGIIEEALTDAGFITLSRNEDTKYFRGREYEGRKDLDFIAYKEGVFYGVEVKNLIAYPNWNDDIVEKKLVADYHGIQFVFVNRTLGPYGYRLFGCGGLYLEFGEIVWSLFFSSLAEKLVKRLYFPIICADKPSSELVSGLKEVPFLHDKYFSRKRKN